jgi:hypothetical protein
MTTTTSSGTGKKLLIALIVLAVAFFGYSYSRTQPVETLANNMITRLSANETQAAYDLLHPNLKGQLSFKKFEQLVERNRLNTIASVQWGKPSSEGEEGTYTIAGRGTTESGGALEASVTAKPLESGKEFGISGFDFHPAKTAQ